MLIRCDVNRDVGSQSLRNKRSNRRKSDGAIIIAGANLVVDGGYKSLTRGEQSVRSISSSSRLLDSLEIRDNEGQSGGNCVKI